MTRTAPQELPPDPWSSEDVLRLLKDHQNTRASYLAARSLGNPGRGNFGTSFLDVAAGACMLDIEP